MSRTIAVETSGRIGSIALADDSALLAEKTFAHGLQHAAQIIPIINRLIGEARWKPAEIEQIHVSIGPGSFTGLRIAVTLAKVLSFSTGARIVAVPTARVLVENAPAEATSAIVALDAKRGQVFTAGFARSSSSAPWSERESAHLDTLRAMIGRAPRPVHLLGEGIAYHRQEIDPDPSVIVTSSETWRARASVVAQIGAEMARRSEFADPWTLTPLYIRLPEAEEKFRQRQADTDSPVS